jgi:hypothetical protein
MTDQPSSLRRAMVFLGLAVEPGAEAGSSRYSTGTSVSRRLDEDLDELRARVEELERRLGG